MTVRELLALLAEIADQDSEIRVRNALGYDDPISTAGVDPDGAAVIILDLREGA